MQHEINPDILHWNNSSQQTTYQKCYIADFKQEAFICIQV